MGTDFVSLRFVCEGMHFVMPKYASRSRSLHLSMQMRQMHLDVLRHTQHMLQPAENANKKCNSLFAIKIRARREGDDVEKPENQSVAAECSFFFSHNSVLVLDANVFRGSD